MASIRLAVPKTASAGETIELKALIQHDMESGHRRGSRGEVIPRDIITEFRCTFEQDTIFAADFHPGIAANPILTFYARVDKSGAFEFKWTDQHGESWSETAQIEVV